MTLEEAKTLLQRCLNARLPRGLRDDIEAALTRATGRPVKYATDEERDEARRKQWSEAKRRAREGRAGT